MRNIRNRKIFIYGNCAFYEMKKPSKVGLYIAKIHQTSDRLFSKKLKSDTHLSKKRQEKIFPRLKSSKEHPLSYMVHRH